VSDSVSQASGSSGAAAAAPKICVLGAGVVGLTTALRLLTRFPEADLTIFAEKFGGDTTTAGAAGVWQPYKLSETPEDLVDR
jgi:glycine/D-amino acid oxidase-like deaminating enzyme